MQVFSETVIEIIQSIPQGKVLTYKAIAELAGCPNGSRQVARLLHSCTGKYNLPWYRVINATGRISLPIGAGFELQKELLESEGVVVSREGAVDLKTYLWELARQYCWASF